MPRSLILASLVLGTIVLTAADQPRTLKLHVVPVPVKSYRLLAMSQDEDGFIWAGSVHQAIHRYDPRTGDVQSVSLPAKAAASACICAGEKVYVLGQTHPRLIIYDRRDQSFVEKAYPSAKPDVWYGTEPIKGRFLYLFDRGQDGVIRWDTATDTGQIIPWPYQTPLPSSGQYQPEDDALWCRIWDMTGGQYAPVGLARLDVANDKFTGFYPFPKAGELLEPATGSKTTMYLPQTLKGKLYPFDFKERRWCQPIDVPGYGTRFGFMGGPTLHKGRLYFSLSTYNGTDTGCDGQPYHFLNSILGFDPATGEFEMLTLGAGDAYHQIAYMLSAGGEFLATGTNIREPDGSLNRDRAGEVVFWQTRQPAAK